MLVFRLTRAAIRYWDCRAAWGTIAMEGMEGGRVVGKLGGRAAQQVQLTTIY
jgi:predicted membrane chloride channel (bestrophin family)